MNTNILSNSNASVIRAISSDPNNNLFNDLNIDQYAEPTALLCKMLGTFQVCIYDDQFNDESYNFLKFMMLPFVDSIQSKPKQTTFIGISQIIKVLLEIIDTYFVNKEFVSKTIVINAHDIGHLAAKKLCAKVIFINTDWENNIAPVMMDDENENDNECMLKEENIVSSEIDENSLRYLLERCLSKSQYCDQCAIHFQKEEGTLLTLPSEILVSQQRTNFKGNKLNVRAPSDEIHDLLFSLFQLKYL